MSNLDPLPEAADPEASRWQRFWAYPITRIVLYLLLFAAIAAATLGLLAGVLHLLPHRYGQNQTVIGLVSEALYASSPVLAFWIMARFVDKRPWPTAGFTRRGLVSGLLGGAAIGTIMLSAGVGVFRLLGFYHVTALVPGLYLLAPLLVYLGVAVSEETLFRGYPFQTLERRWGSGVALAASSLLFGLAHLGNRVPGETGLHQLAGPLLICLEAGLPLGAAFLLTRRMWLPIGIHWAWDYCEGPIYGCPDSGVRDPHTLLHAYFSGPFYATGGAFGPEAGVVLLTVGTVTGLLLLWAAVRRGQWQPSPGRSKLQSTLP